MVTRRLATFPEVSIRLQMIAAYAAATSTSGVFALNVTTTSRLSLGCGVQSPTSGSTGEGALASTADELRVKVASGTRVRSVIFQPPEVRSAGCALSFSSLWGLS